MRRVMLASVGICGVLGLAISLSIVIGRGQPPSAGLAQLHLSDCESPCIMGVTLGKANFDQVKQTFAAATIPPGYTAEVTQTIYEPYRVAVLLLKNDLGVPYTMSTYVDFYEGMWRSAAMTIDVRHNNPPQFADLVGLYGAPTCAYWTYGVTGNHYRVVYIVDQPRALAVRLTMPLAVRFPLRWSSRVLDISIANLPAGVNPCTCSRWKGITAKYPMEDRNGACSAFYN
jgi:hypothetical protein